MNITSKVFSDENYRKSYFDTLKALDSQKNMFMDYTRKIQQAANKKKKAESKKRKSSGVMVTGATSKSEIARLKRVLVQKIAETISEEDNDKLKTMQLSILNSKLEALDRILSQIERIERKEKEKKRYIRKKGKTDAVYLTKDDLTVKKNGHPGFDVSITGEQDAMPAPSGIDLVADYEAAVNAATESNTTDVQV